MPESLSLITIAKLGGVRSRPGRKEGNDEGSSGPNALGYAHGAELRDGGESFVM